MSENRQKWHTETNRDISTHLFFYWDCEKIIDIRGSGHKHPTVKFTHVPATGEWYCLLLLLVQYAANYTVLCTASYDGMSRQTQCKISVLFANIIMFDTFTCHRLRKPIYTQQHNMQHRRTPNLWSRSCRFESWLFHYTQCSWASYSHTCLCERWYNLALDELHQCPVSKKVWQCTGCA